MIAPPRARCAGKTCSFRGCSKPAEKLLLCGQHYNTRPRPDAPKCIAAECDARQSFGRKGLCNKHYIAQYRRKRDVPCVHCDRPSIAKNMCSAHYTRAKRGYSMNKPITPRYHGAKCSVDACLGEARAHGLCSMHRYRDERGLDLAAPKRHANPDGFLCGNGYRAIPVGRKHVMQHRLFMEQSLGRPLTADETVHHKNGHRADNRMSNLELWSTRQPKGQRVEDKVRWAREILATYGELFPER